MKKITLMLAAAVCGLGLFAEPVAKPFGCLADGRAARIWRICGAGGLTMDVTDYGGRVVRLYAPDRYGNLADVTLGFNEVGEYEKLPAKNLFLGAIIGRFGNRIADGKFTIDGKTYQLPINEEGNSRHCNLHGGPDGWDKRFWTPSFFENGDVKGVKFTLVSPDGDMGFPGEVKVTVTYTITPDNSWKVDYEAVTDKPTVINMTSHTFWNLAGEASGDVRDQDLMIFADKYTQTTPGLIPTSDAPVAGTGFDFTTLRPIGHAKAWMAAQASLKWMDNWYDHNFVLRGEGNAMRPAVKMRDMISGRTMEISTTEPCLQVYGAQNFSEKMPAKQPGRRYAPFAGIALETQHYPDSPNRPDYPSTLLRPGETYHTTTVYKFGIE